jgi:hypothetical protein
MIPISPTVLETHPIGKSSLSERIEKSELIDTIGQTQKTRFRLRYLTQTQASKISSSHRPTKQIAKHQKQRVWKPNTRTPSNSPFQGGEPRLLSVTPFWLPPFQGGTEGGKNYA